MNQKNTKKKEAEKVKYQPEESGEEEEKLVLDYSLPTHNLYSF